MTMPTIKYVKPGDYFRLVVTCQDHENYAWGEDGSLGVGDDAYWKAKGGSDWCIALLTPQEANALSQAEMERLVEESKQHIEINNDGFRSQVAFWNLLKPGELTGKEKDWQEFEGGFGLGDSACPCSMAWWKMAKRQSAQRQAANISHG